MKTYDACKIGATLSWFGDHHISMYGEDRVIKFSRVNLLRQSE